MLSLAGATSPMSALGRLWTHYIKKDCVLPGPLTSPLPHTDHNRWCSYRVFKETIRVNGWSVLLCLYVLWIFILTHTVVSVSQHSHLYVTFGKKMRWKQILPRQNINIFSSFVKQLSEREKYFSDLTMIHFQTILTGFLYALCSPFVSVLYAHIQCFIPLFLWTLFHNSKKKWCPHLKKLQRFNIMQSPMFTLIVEFTLHLGLKAQYPRLLRNIIYSMSADTE